MVRVAAFSTHAPFEALGSEPSLTEKGTDDPVALKAGASRGNDPAGNASHAALAFDGGVALGAWSAGVAATQLDHVIWLGLGFALAALALLKRALRQ